MANIACTVMLKDERDHLEPFVAYYSYLFGMENIYVVDNGSTDDFVRRKLSEYENKGLHVERGFPSAADYRRKGEIVSEIVVNLEKTGSYDFYVLLDCDEFLLHRLPDDRYSCDKTVINAYFDDLVGERRVLTVNENLMNVIGKPNCYIKAPYAKTIYPKGVFKSTDHGHHIPVNKSDAGSLNVDIVYLHMHFRPYDQLVKFAEAKLRPFINNGDSEIIDKDELIKFTGPGNHMVNYLISGEEAYYQSADQSNPNIYFDDIDVLLRKLGARLPYANLTR